MWRARIISAFEKVSGGCYVAELWHANIGRIYVCGGFVVLLHCIACRINIVRYGGWGPLPNLKLS